MKKIIILLFICYYSFNSYSQNTTKSVDIDLKKNAIGVSTGAIYTYGIPKSGMSYHYEIFYLRYFNSKNAFKIGSSNIFTNRNNYVNHEQPIFFIIDKERFSSFETDLSIGFEQSFGNRKTKFILGEDLLLGYRRNHFQTLYKDNSNSIISASDFYLKYFKLGIAINLGVEYSISKKFSIGLKTKPEFVFFNEIKSKKSSSSFSKADKIINFNLRSEIVFTYKF